MNKQFVINFVLRFANNSLHFSIIFLHLVNCFTSLTANPMNKSFHNKCHSIALPAEQSEYGFNNIADQLRDELTLRLFGLNRSAMLRKGRQRRRHSIAPQYMIDLYSMASNNDNNFSNNYKNNMKYNSNTIRSVSHSDTSETSLRLHFNFNLSQQLIPSNEHIIEVEFHIYKLVSQPKHHFDRSEDPKHNLLEVKVFQILSKESKSDLRLLDVRRMSTHSMGWDVFYVKQAVLDWVQNQSTNYGLLLTVKSLLNEEMENGIRFANRYRNHLNKQPMIVVFTTDNQFNYNLNQQKLNNSEYDFGIQFNGFDKNDEKIESKDRNLSENQTKETFIESNEMSYSSESSLSSSLATQICNRRQISIDLSALGWSTSIIAPKGFTAFICDQKCINPFKQNIFAKSDTTSRNASPLEKRCCVANKFNALNVLYFDERGNVILKRLDAFIVNSCVAQLCH